MPEGIWIGLAVWLVAAAEAPGPPRLDVAEAFDPAQYVDRDVAIRGRVAGSTPILIRLARCAIKFRPAEGGPFGRLPRAGGNAELSGRLVRSGDGYEVLTSRVESLPDDREELKDRLRRLAPDDSQGWLQAGDWAMRRGRFYDDPSLVAEARQCYVQAIAIQRHTLAPTDVDGLLKLAQLAGKFLGPTEQLSLTQEAMIAAYRRSEDQPAAACFALAAQVDRLLPGADKPLSEAQRASVMRLWPSGRPGSAELLRQAAPAQQAAFHRWLYLQVLERAFEKSAASAGGRAAALHDLAVQAERMMPDAPDAIRRLWQQWAALRQTESSRLTVAELEQLAVVLRDKVADKAQALQVARQFLERRREALSAQDAEGRVALARQCLEWGFRDMGLDLAKQAARLAPKLPEAVRLLTDAGLVYDGQAWVPAEQFASTDQGRIHAAMLQGRVVRGMTRDQVLKAQGSPDQKSCTLTGAGVCEQWLYRGDPPLIVTFLKNNVKSVYPPSTSSEKPSR